MTPLDAAWEAVLGAPNDDRALMVLADALMERGDPHGELIRLQLAGDEAGANEHLARNARALFGAELAMNAWSFRFARGFVTSLKMDSVAEFEALMTRPVCRLLEEVRVGAAPSLRFEADPIERIVEVLATRAPRTVTALRFDSNGGETPGDLAVAPLAARFPSLEDLSLTATAWGPNFEGAHNASLCWLSLSLAGPIVGLSDARFPSLSGLELELPYRAIEFPAGLLEKEVAPNLDSLTLRGALWPTQLRALAQSPLLQGLSHLEIAAEAETAWYPALLQAASAFAHLEQFELFPDRHYPDWVAAVKAALPRAIIREPRPRL